MAFPFEVSGLPGDLHFRWRVPATAIPWLVLAGVFGAMALVAKLSAPTPQPSPQMTAAPAKPTVHAVAAVKSNALAAPDTTAEKAKPTAFELEQQMSTSQRIKRWDPFVIEAAKRFGVPQVWIRAVMQAESAGRTQLVEGKPITSSQGAMGLMQLMPETYAEMRKLYRLGGDPYDPHDNIIAATAYLRWLRGRYGYPTMFAAYNDGPGNLEQRMLDGGLLPQETRDYLLGITIRVEGKGGSGANAKLTRPDGSAVMINAGAVVSIRAALPDEYAPSVRSVITIGRVKQGVREDLLTAKVILRARGGAI